MTKASAVRFPVELKGSVFRNTDWAFSALVILVFIVYGTVVMMMSRIPIPEPSAEDIRALQNQFAKFVLKTKPKKAEKAAPAKAADTEVAEVKTETAKKAENRVKERSTSSAEEKKAARAAAAENRAQAREKAAAQVANVGALAMLTAIGDGSDDDEEVVEDLLGTGAVQSKNLGTALASLDGLQSGGSGARTGRSRRGRRGGSGSAGASGVDNLLSGIGTQKSKSLSRKGSFKLNKPDAVVGKAAKAANRSIKAINAVLAGKQGAIQFCYKKELRKNPGLSGKVTLKFTIEHSGRVSKASVVSSSINSASLNACIKKTIQRLRFKPIAASEGSMTVTYPFVFRAG